MYLVVSKDDQLEESVYGESDTIDGAFSILVAYVFSAKETGCRIEPSAVHEGVFYFVHPSRRDVMYSLQVIDTTPADEVEYSVSINEEN